MQIIIMRHGEAVAGADCDANRVLTPRGEEQARSSGKQLARLLNANTRCFASPYLRAQQTARIASESWPVTQFETLGHLTPDTPPDWTAAAVDKLLGDKEGEWPDSVVLVAHMPIVARLTGLLTGEPPYAVPGFSTACAAVLEADVLAADCASLRHFVQPES
jgi:phosphohistidine phosphatase